MGAADTATVVVSAAVAAVTITAEAAATVAAAVTAKKPEEPVKMWDSEEETVGDMAVEDLALEAAKASLLQDLEVSTEGLEVVMEDLEVATEKVVARADAVLAPVAIKGALDTVKVEMRVA